MRVSRSEISYSAVGRVLRQQRVSFSMTIAELAAKSGVSSSHITRIERGERNPSGIVLRKLAEPLGMAQEELFTIAGYLSHPAKAMVDAQPTKYPGRLDPDIARFLAREPRSVQRSAIPLIQIIANLAKASVR